MRSNANPRSGWGRLRTFVVLAGLVMPFGAILAPAVAQNPPGYVFDAAKVQWQEYRPSTLSVRIDMPGKAEISSDKGPFDNSEETAAEVMFDRATFAIRVWTFTNRVPLTPKELTDAIDYSANGQRAFFGIEPKVTRINLKGAVGREDVFEFQGTVARFQTVSVGGSIVQISVVGGSDDAIKAATDRFMKSFDPLR